MFTVLGAVAELERGRSLLSASRQGADASQRKRNPMEHTKNFIAQVL
jgi:hypothetical protein